MSKIYTFPQLINSQNETALRTRNININAEGNLKLCHICTSRCLSSLLTYSGNIVLLHTPTYSYTTYSSSLLIIIYGFLALIKLFKFFALWHKQMKMQPGLKKNKFCFWRNLLWSLWYSIDYINKMIGMIKCGYKKL